MGLEEDKAIKAAQEGWWVSRQKEIQSIVGAYGSGIHVRISRMNRKSSWISGRPSAGGGTAGHGHVDPA